VGTFVEIPHGGGGARGYLAVPAGGSGPGVMVVQEWWGLVAQIEGVCDRLAREGFVALAPDLFRGEVAAHDEMDKAGRLMSELPLERAAADMGAAVDFLLAHDAVAGDRIGVIGFCMGGMLTLVVAAQQGAKVGAAVPFYGAPIGASEPDWSNLSAAVHGHFAERDDFFPPDAVTDLERRLRAMGKDVVFEIHEGTGHAFANEENPLGTHHPEAADRAWSRAVPFLHERLG